MTTKSALVAGIPPSPYAAVVAGVLGNPAAMATLCSTAKSAGPVAGQRATPGAKL